MLILNIALAADIVVRSLILKQQPQRYWDILLIWIATTLYVCIGMTASGVQPLGAKWSRFWQILLSCVVGITLTGTAMGTVHSVSDLIGTIAGAAAGCFVALVALRVIYGTWERRALGRGPREG